MIGGEGRAQGWRRAESLNDGLKRRRCGCFGDRVPHSDSSESCFAPLNLVVNAICICWLADLHPTYTQTTAPSRSLFMHSWPSALISSASSHSPSTWFFRNRLSYVSFPAYAIPLLPHATQPPAQADVPYIQRVRGHDLLRRPPPSRSRRPDASRVRGLRRRRA